MRSRSIVALGFIAATGLALSAQTPYTPAHLQAPRDPGYAALIATCKTPPPTPAPRGGGAPGARPGGAAPAAAAQGAAPQGRPGGAAPAGPAQYAVTEIPGVIAAGQRWKLEWQVVGNNADGILADDDGGLLLAQNDNGAIVKLVNGKVTTLYRDLNTSGAMSKTPKGALFVVERGLHNAVRQLTPQNRVHANTFNGDPLDCLGGVINDLTADSKGGVYFTHGGLFYADAKGIVTRYGENLRTNGVVLSADEKTLYVTNGNSVAAFDVQANGSLTNQRVFVMLPSGGGDGLTIDSQGRLYITAGPNLHVAAPDGKLLGSIPSPVSLITAAFAGPDKKTMYAVTSLRAADGTQSAEVYSIPMIAQGYAGRAK
jgi:gluconolactonase